MKLRRVISKYVDGTYEPTFGDEDGFYFSAFYSERSIALMEAARECVVGSTIADYTLEHESKLPVMFKMTEQNSWKNTWTTTPL